MRVRTIDSDNDWTFGKGRANYITGSRAIAQNVKTRLQSFANDWFLNIDAGVDWVSLLGNLSTRPRILRAVERTVLQTGGVLSIQRLQVLGKDANRGIRVEVLYTDVFGVENTIQTGVEI